jgi:alkyl sulfatase BDS1-like metallo-beta-lactamase superfamily hydrolase
MTKSKDASESTRAWQRACPAALPEDDGLDFGLASRGFIATIPNADCGKAWSMAGFDFLDGERPDTVNPSLWRQARLNALHGLFEVCPRIHQVRGFDISNVTFIEGDSGYIVVDPLTSAEPAAAALELVRRERGDRPVVAVIYTHSHVDHYGGIRGVLADAASGRVPIIAPEGFLAAAVSENVLLGNVMTRRSSYMYGALLARGPRGHVDSGLGKGGSHGSVSLIGPTIDITHTGQKMVVDGVEIVFQMTPDTEAPAEMNFFFPQFGALCMAENCSCHMHNLYTPRGAQVRDARNWSRYIEEARQLWAGESEVMFASHHWPRWGNPAIDTFLRQQRDMYRYVHDQSLRLANHGLVSSEIAESLELHPSLAREWHTRGYYGTLSHNAKAVYQKYLGWFDGNPAHLHPLPPEAAGARYVELAGGADALLANARAAFDAGEYRWVAELVNHLVFADPANVEARQLQADTLEQLGYRAESGPWRDFYLTGAMELRNPPPAAEAPRQASTGQLRSLRSADLLSALAIRLNGPKTGETTIACSLHFREDQSSWDLWIENAVLHSASGENYPKIEIDRHTLIDLVTGRATVSTARAERRLAGEGLSELERLLPLLDRFDFWFNIVTP